MSALRVTRSPVSPAELEAAFAALDTSQGIYFGCDAGVPGLHPLQAHLVPQASLSLRVHADGVCLRVHDDFGQALLALPPVQAWRANHEGRGAHRNALTALKAFHDCLQGQAEAMLLGALRFDAWRLAPGAAAGTEQPLGVEEIGLVVLAQRRYERDAQGQWNRVELSTFAAPDSLPRDKAATEATRPVAPKDLPAARDDHPPGGYARMVSRALTDLRGGELVSLTLSQSYRRACQVSPAAAFARLRAVNPAPASFFVNDGLGTRLFGASPDLQLVIQGREVQALPVCGTVARQPGPLGEAQSLRELINEEVDAASLAVCTDALRGDLAALCEPGSLRLRDRRRPMALATVVHTVDRLSGVLRPDAGAWDAIAATAAPVMVTGTPRAAALRSIAALEASPRGWYGGLVFMLRGNGDAIVGTILRAAHIRQDASGSQQAEVRTGGDLLADSDPQREEQESRTKSLSLWRALGIASATDDVVDNRLSGPGAPSTDATALQPWPVRLAIDGDPFGASVHEAVLGLRAMPVPSDDTQAPLIVAGPHVQTTLRNMAATPGHAACIAIGDAALCLLGQHGFDVRPTTPRHGRISLAHATPLAPAGIATAPFHVARYQTLELAPRSAPGAPWEVWMQDDAGEPLLLVHRGLRLAALLYRPESLLTAPPGLAALRLVAETLRHGDR